ncbi:MAG: 30S ribosomal protein S17, partial [Nanoarchaeota archaeon]
MAKKQNEKFGKEKKVVGTVNDNGKEKYSLRGRKFEGYVIRKFDKRITIEFERVNYIKKYERYAKSKTKIHARLPENLRDSVKIGDYVQLMECRPLSKIIHHVVIKKIRD